MLRAETWMTAKIAKEKGFVDTIIESGKGVKASFDLSIFSNLPDEFRADRDHELTERDAEKALRDAGFSRSKAKALLAGRKPDAKSEDELKREAEEKGAADCAASLKRVISIFE
jgi:hypothetical protein